MTSLHERAVVEERTEPADRRTDQPNRSPLRVVRPVGGAEDRLLHLTRTIETEVIPRLLLASRAAVPVPAAPAAVVDDVSELADLLLTREVEIATAFVAGLNERGTRLDALFLDLLAPTARHLGDLWCEDLCSFSEVTLGLVRLQQVLREFSPGFHAEVEPRQLNRRALLVPVPGEQHTFGLNMVAEFFRRAGWDVWCAPLNSEEELARIVRRRWFAVVGLSLGSEARMDRLASGVRAVRRASRNKAVGIMVGGPSFVEQPDLVARVGADTTASDARQATVQAERMLDLLAVNG